MAENKDELDIDYYVNQKLEKATQIYAEEMFPDDNSIFKELHEIMEDEDNDHNCLGCNLDEYAILVYSTLLLLDAYTSIEQRMKMLIMTTYLLVERIDTILNIIDLHAGYKSESFKSLNKIRKWANFVKHPKAFILAHHPIYTIEGFEHNSELIKAANKVINSSFIYRYYSNDDRNRELFKELENKEDVIVVFPNPVEIIQSFCRELKLFNRILRNNEIYREILKKRSTFLGFWMDEEE